MNVLIIGLGSIAKKHIEALINIDSNTKVYALRSSSSTDSYKNVINLYHENQLEELDFDFVIISNPTSKHEIAIELATGLNIPIFIEKPLFNELNKEKLIKKINDLKIQTYVACNLRFLECIQYSKQILADKRINEVNAYCGSYLPDWRPNLDFRTVYSANKEKGGGVHIDLIHEIDYIYWMFKAPNKVNKNFSSKSSLNISAFDYANYLLEYSEFSANIVLNYYRRDNKRTLEVVCEDGTLYVDLLQNSVLWNSDLIYSSDKKIIDTYVDQMKFFVNKVLSSESSFNDINESYEILKICLQD